MKSKELKEWLRGNSSGIYRPAAEAADYIDQLEESLQYMVDNIGQPRCIETRGGFNRAENLLSDNIEQSQTANGA